MPSLLMTEQMDFFDLVITGSSQRVRAALNTGADVNARNSYGKTPLMEAAEYNPNPESISVLLAAGADLKSPGQGRLYRADGCRLQQPEPQGDTHTAGGWRGPRGERQGRLYRADVCRADKQEPRGDHDAVESRRERE